MYNIPVGYYEAREEKNIRAKEEQCSEIEKLLNKEIRRVKSLTSNKGKWLVSNRKDNYIYKNNPVSILNGIGPTTSHCLSEARIKTIGDV